jgi:hypothetical protein
MVVRSTSFIISTSARAWPDLAIAIGTGPRTDHARHLDDRALVQERQRGAVGGVEDQHRARVERDRLEHRHRLVS